MAKDDKAETEAADPENPRENTPSDLDDLTHAEFLAVYGDASENIRFAKDHQWQALLYFSVGAIVTTGYGEWTNWADRKLAIFLLIMIWVFSIGSVGVIASLQWWQAAEGRKITFVTSKWSSFTNAARRRKSPLISDVQRYGMLIAMILYLELVTIAVSRIFLSHL